MPITTTVRDGIAEVVMHHPPVNALTVADTWAIRDAFVELSRDPALRAVVLTAEGRGFNAGIDIKEMQSVEGFDHILGSSEACYATFHAIYETPVPVIAAVNDFCIGLGIGLDVAVTEVDVGGVEPGRVGVEGRALIVVEQPGEQLVIAQLVTERAGPAEVGERAGQGRVDKARVVVAHRGPPRRTPTSVSWRTRRRSSRAPRRRRLLTVLGLASVSWAISGTE